MLSIARSELVQIFRNRAVLVTSCIVPIAVCVFFIQQRDTFEKTGSLGYIGAILVFTVAAFGLYSTIVTTLAARRQTLFLKRLRSTAASDPAILTGLVLPAAGIALIQTVLLVTVLSIVSRGPDNPLLLATAVVATLAMMLGLGLATAGLTNSPEHAQVTTLPITLGTLAVASWVGIAGTDDLTLLKRLLPGGSAAELIINAWNGGIALSDSMLLLAPTLAWVVVAVAAASRLIAWEPRR